MQTLKNSNYWLGWKYHKTKDGKTTKPPYNIRTGKQCGSNNPTNCVTYEQAYSNKDNYNGVGFIVPVGYVVIDVDGLEEHTKENPLQQETYKLFEQTYVEKSPSGSGIHIVAKCDLNRIPTTKGEKGKIKLDSRYYQKNANKELECYFGGITNRYITYTGNVISPKDEITDQTEAVLEFLNKYMLKDIAPTFDEIDDIINKARKAKNGHIFSALFDYGNTSAYNNDDSRADLALCNYLAFWFQGKADLIDEAFKRSKLYRDKWEREDYRAETINKAIQNCAGKFYKGAGRPRKNDKEDLLDFTPEILEEYLTEKNISIKWNEMTQTANITGVQGESKEHINANLPAILFSKLQGKYKRCNMNTIQSYLDIIATRNKYNPVIDLLDNYTYDGKDYLTEFLEILGIDDEDELSKTLIKKWLWQGIAMLHNDEEKPFGAESVLVFTGRQGIGKTSAFRKLCLIPELFKSGVCIDFRDKDTYINASTGWIVELGEIESTFKKDVEQLKAFITQERDIYRKPYARDTIQAIRRTNLCGSCNSDRFLIDTTGNRRFWTVPLEYVDLARLESFNALQLWKQIELIALNNLQGFRLTQEESKLLAERNGEHEKLLKGEEEILDILNYENSDLRYMTITEFKNLYPSLRNYSSIQISMVLDKLGYTMKKKKVAGKVQRVRLLPLWRESAFY